MGVLIQNGVNGNIVFAALIMASQCLGGFIGLFFVYTMSVQEKVFGTDIQTIDPHLKVAPSDLLYTDKGDVNWISVALVEVYGTFLFVSCILMLKTSDTASSHAILNCFACGMCLFTQVITIGGVSGGCLNPAVGLTANVYYSVMLSNQFNPWKITMTNYLVYIFAPLTGGLIAGFVHKILQSFKNAIETDAELASKFD